MTLEGSDKAAFEQTFGDRHETVAAAIAAGDELDETDQARLEQTFGERTGHIGQALRGELGDDADTGGKSSTSKSSASK